MNTWLISDTHFDHGNIIRYCNRPFVSVEDMNETLVRNWRDTVKSDDLVFMLGDIAMGRHYTAIDRWLRQLTGRIFLVKGSHDHELRAPYYRLLHADNKDWLLVHNPDDTPVWWTGWVIHGHLHNQAPFIDHGKKRVNVSVEAIDYQPVAMTAILKELNIANSMPR